jgi:hypothetical protein
MLALNVVSSGEFPEVIELGSNASSSPIRFLRRAMPEEMSGCVKTGALGGLGGERFAMAGLTPNHFLTSETTDGRSVQRVNHAFGG